MSMHAWKPRGALAAKAETWGAEFEGALSVRRLKNVAVITVRGPLDMHPSWCGFANYDDLFAAFVECLDADAIVLDLDSPGGVASGCFEAARAIRALPLPPTFAVANAYACSAAYALACVADQIVALPSAVVGSIGVRGGFISWDEANKAMGLAVRPLTSGAQKLDGDPDMPIDEDALAREQLVIDELASQFFAWVSERRGVDAKPLEGAAFLGSQAMGKGLIDGVATLGQVLGALLIQSKG